MGIIKQQVFLEKCKNIYGDTYDLSKVNYRGSEENISVICSKHGEFQISAHDFLRGNGCPKCGHERGSLKRILSQEEIIQRFHHIHGNKYDYSKFVYVKQSIPSIIICPKHGEFLQTPRKHLMGSGCKQCGYEKNSKTQLKSSSLLKKEIDEKYNGKYSLSECCVYNGSKTQIEMICSIHGKYKTYVSTVLKGNGGCKLCFETNVREKASLTKNEFIERSKQLFGDNTFNYNKIEKYINNKTPILLICKKCGTEFLVRPDNHLYNRSGCPHCVHQISKWEQEINDFILSLGVTTEQTNRTILNNKEIDIYIPQFNIGIECDGLRWHNELFKDKNYHLEKTNSAETKGIRLFHIFEDEWNNKKNIVKSILKNAFCFNDRNIYARKCSIQEIDNKTKTSFLNENHIQGNCNSSINYGLYYNDELISVMTFGKLRKNLGSVAKNGNFELLRFCNKLYTNVIGGASKLFNHFIKMINPNEIISYCDIRLFQGYLYEKLGFSFSHTSQPNYFYVFEMERKNRFNFRKDILIKEGYDKNKTEHEIMLERGIYRIYDCGCRVYKWNNKSKVED